jgi:hypothetical protein
MSHISGNERENVNSQQSTYSLFSILFTFASILIKSLSYNLQQSHSVASYMKETVQC